MTLPAIVLAAVLAAATSVHFPVSTNDPQAQAAIDRGLFLYYAYNGDGAGRSFDEAASRSWPSYGLLGNRPSRGARPQHADDGCHFEVAQRAIRHAVLLSGAASERERTFVAIMARRYAGTFADWNADDAAYRDAMTAFRNPRTTRTRSSWPPRRCWNMADSLGRATASPATNHAGRWSSMQPCCATIPRT